MNSRLLFFLFFSVLTLVTMNNTLPLMGAPYIVGELGGSNDIAFYSVTFYSIGNALGVPIGKACLGRMKPSSFFLCFLLLSAFLSFCAAQSGDYPTFLTFRLFKGICGGTFFPMISQLFGRIGAENQKDPIAYTIVTIFTVAPAFAASCGGWVSYDHHWQWLFYANIPLFCILAVALWKELRYWEGELEKHPFDGVGYLLYVVTLLCFSFFITLGQQLDWFRSPLLATAAALAVVVGVFFVLWELRHPFPILDFRLLKNFVFSFALLQLIVLFSAYFGMVILLAFWLTLWVNYTPIWIGLILGTMALSGFLPRLMFFKGYEDSDCRIPLLISILLLAYSSFHTALFNVEIDLGRIAISRVIAGFGLAFFLTPLFRLCFRTFPEAKGLAVIGFFQVGRVLASGLGAAIYITLWQRRQSFFHQRLGSELTLFDPETHHYFDHAATLGLQGESAVAKLADLLDRQSIALALDDCFYLMGWILVALFILVACTYLFRCKGFKPETASVKINE